MIHNLKKKTVFFTGIFFTSIVGYLGNYFHTNFSKGDSLLINKAQADVPLINGYTQAQWDIYNSGGSDGGCCSDASDSSGGDGGDGCGCK